MSRQRPYSLTLRLALIFALLAFALLATLGVALYRELERELIRRDDTALISRVDQLRNLLSDSNTLDLIKPFSFAELVARLRTLTRRGPSREEEQLHIADLQIDVLKRRVTRSGTRITLTNKEFALLHLFATHQDQVLSRSMIASRVWDMNFDSDTNVVDVAVRRLRLKIDDPFQLKLIHSVRGIGYRFDTQP